MVAIETEADRLKYAVAVCADVAKFLDEFTRYTDPQPVTDETGLDLSRRAISLYIRAQHVASGGET